ncbi:MAG: hypothetical protein HYZ16_03395 [Bacteroidetes bacterium]|nr:hypothetical protein [Bacteroidota bacterium]
MLRFIICVLLCLPLCGYGAYVFSPECQHAYALTFRGSFEEARRSLSVEKEKSPDNAAIDYLLVLNAFMATITVEDPVGDQSFLDDQIPHLQALEQSTKHPFKLYALGEAYLQRGMVALRLGNYVNGLLDLKKSYGLLERNLKEYPSFPLTKKPLYTLQGILSNVPDTYKPIFEFFGYQTDQYVALAELDKLQQALRTDPYYGFFRREVELVRGIMTQALTDRHDDAYAIIKAITTDYGSNPLACYVRGKMALDTKRTDEAIEILLHYAGEKAPFQFMNYDLGNAYLYSHNKLCLKYFAVFISHSPGPGLKNDTYLRLAWWGHLNGDTAMRSLWLGFIQDPCPSAREKDKVAIEEGKTLEMTHPDLLAGRLWFDGGYYSTALRAMEGQEAAFATSPFNHIRHLYLKARILEEMGKYHEAMMAYDQVTALPFHYEEYFVPVAYFRKGCICETALQEPKKALAHYRTCLTFKNYPYAATYKYKCQLGLNRLEGTGPGGK